MPSHWNFEQGSDVIVWVFANNEVDTVKLNLNGAPVGGALAVTDEGWYHVVQNMTFAPVTSQAIKNLLGTFFLLGLIACDYRVSSRLRDTQRMEPR